MEVPPVKKLFLASALLAVLSACTYLYRAYAEPPPIDQYDVVYYVDGPCRLSLTYTNVHQGIQQDEVDPPWWYAMNPANWSYLSLSAQKLCEGGGAVVVEIYVGGRVVRKAESTAPYGVAWVYGIYQAR